MHIPALAERLLTVLGEEEDAPAAAGRQAVKHLGTQWGNSAPLVQAQQAYAQAHGASEDVAPVTSRSTRCRAFRAFLHRAAR